MAIREAMDTTVLKLHPSKEFTHPIPTLVKEAEGCSDRIVCLWDDFRSSLNRHVTLSKNTFGRPRNILQHVAFCNGVERLCADFTRRCENVTIVAECASPRQGIGLRIHRLRPVPLKDRHQHQSFVANIPEIETTVPVRATFVGMQDCCEAPPIMVATLDEAEVVSSPCCERQGESSSSSLVYAEVLGPA